MTAYNPLAGNEAEDRHDVELARRIGEGDATALDELVARHQEWIYNIALRMVYLPEDAEDATQDVMLKLLTKLSTFEGKSRFRTWLYRVVVNHVLNMKRTRADTVEWTFEKYGSDLDSTEDLELPDPESVPVDVQLLVDEARIGCSTGMLLCLSREQRLIYILGAIFGVADTVGAELLDISKDNFRQRLARARHDLHSFMESKCGLVKTTNPCRCAKKTRAFMKAGYLDPNRLLFAGAHVRRVQDVAESVHEDINALDAAYAAIHRSHPFLRSPDFVAAVRRLIEQPEFQSVLGSPKN
jgi:RNA polymerase sigma factor (sigma-70 family)